MFREQDICTLHGLCVTLAHRHAFADAFILQFLLILSGYDAQLLRIFQIISSSLFGAVE